MTESSTPKKKWPVKRTVLISMVTLLLIVGYLLYRNFNQILSDRLISSFNSTIFSDVYELKFEKLAVNPFEGTIRIFEVTLLPRAKPLKEYPYINSSFRLKTEKLTLKNVSFLSLLKSKQLNLERISITKPDVEIMLAGERHIMLPFKDSTLVESQGNEEKGKPLESFILREFQLINASFHTFNEVKQREFNIRNFNISLYDLMVDQKTGAYLTSSKQVILSIGKFTGDLKTGGIKHIGFTDFNFEIDSITTQSTLDTLLYHFQDFKAGINNLDIQTARNIFHLTLQSFALSYQDKAIHFKNLDFKPNVGHDVLQKDHPYQHTEFSGSVGTLAINGINFDSLIYRKKLFINEIVLDELKAFVFKDKTKPLDSNKFPAYLGQTIAAIRLPLKINRIKATRVNLENTERKPDSTYVKVNLTRATLEVKNLTNQPTGQGLLIRADAYIEDKAHFNTTLTFDYKKPQFGFEAQVQSFKLSDLNPMIEAYTPAKIISGNVDEIAFSGVAEQTHASGTYKFLYHDLKIELELQQISKWKNSIITFAANSVLSSSNPGSSTLPPRIVAFKIDRDMNKGFVNVVLKSLLNGLKETMIMSKENRKAYGEAKGKEKKKRKEEKKKKVN